LYSLNNNVSNYYFLVETSSIVGSTHRESTSEVARLLWSSSSWKILGRTCYSHWSSLWKFALYRLQ